MKIDLSKIDAVIETIEKGTEVILFLDANSINYEQARSIQIDKANVIVLDVPMGKHITDVIAMYKVKK